MTPAQLDRLIASLGMALADAHAHGDTEGARAKLAEMHAAIRLRDLNIKLLVPDAKGSATVNEHSPISIVIGAQSDEGKRGRMRRRAI